jgi:hypothetical protein
MHLRPSTHPSAQKHKHAPTKEKRWKTWNRTRQELSWKPTKVTV